MNPVTPGNAMHDTLKFDPIRKELHGVLMTLGLVAAITAVLFALVWEVGLAHGSVVYLIPVVIAATRWESYRRLLRRFAVCSPRPSSSTRRSTASA